MHLHLPKLGDEARFLVGVSAAIGFDTFLELLVLLRLLRQPLVGIEGPVEVGLELRALGELLLARLRCLPTKLLESLAQLGTILLLVSRGTQPEKVRDKGGGVGGVGG